MAYRYTIDPNVNCVFITHFDVFDIEEVTSQYLELMDDPRHRPGMNILRDCSSAPLSAEWTLDRMMSTSRTRLEEFLPRLGRCRIAWVVSGPRDLGRVNQLRLVLADDHPDIDRRPFLGQAEAMAWLGLPEDYKIPGD